MPISLLMYQPLKGAAGNSSPPISSSMLETAGSAYQRSPSSANHASLRGAFRWDTQQPQFPPAGAHPPSQPPPQREHPQPHSREGRPAGSGSLGALGAQPHSRGVLEGHLEDQLGWEGEELGGLLGALQQQGQHVEAAAAGAPAVLDAELGGGSVRVGWHQGTGGPGARGASPPR